jgi:hypothetical protein
MTSAGGAVTMSRLSLQYVSVPVQAYKGGTVYNPTNDVVEFAFVQNYGTVPSSWAAGSWVSQLNYTYPYAAQCLVGPGGATAPTTGVYNIWVQIQDDPEVPVFIAGQLQII